MENILGGGFRSLVLRTGQTGRPFVSINTGLSPDLHGRLHEDFTEIRKVAIVIKTLMKICFPMTKKLCGSNLYYVMFDPFLLSSIQILKILK